MMIYKGICTLVEVKKTIGKSKSLRKIINGKEKYHIEATIKIGDYNIGRNGEILSILSYMAFMLNGI